MLLFLGDVGIVLLFNQTELIILQIVTLIWIKSAKLNLCQPVWRFVSQCIGSPIQMCCYFKHHFRPKSIRVSIFSAVSYPIRLGDLTSSVPPKTFNGYKCMFLLIRRSVSFYCCLDHVFLNLRVKELHRHTLLSDVTYHKLLFFCATVLLICFFFT